jgi:hypothetical protein
MRPVLLLALVAAGCAVQGTQLPPLGLAPEPAAEEEADTCGAARFAYLVGQRNTVVERTALPDGARVILPGQPVTTDFRAERLNVLIDGNAEVERVYCG